MKTFEEYMNTPEIVKEPLFLREVHAARLAIQDETKSMTPEEKVQYINRLATAFLYGNP